MALYFPPDPVNGQKYVGTNGITYTWVDNRWNGVLALSQGDAEYYVDNGGASFNYDPDINNELDGGNAAGSEVILPTVSLSLADTSLTDSWSSGQVGYTVSAGLAEIIEVGIMQATTDSAYASNGNTLYPLAVDYCIGGNVYASAGETILKYILNANNNPSNSNCGEPIETNIPLDTPIQQWITAFHGYGNVDYDIYAYAKTANSVVISEKLNWRGYFPCLAAGTMITLGDRSYKAIEDISYSDTLLVWNFDLGEFSDAIPLWIKVKQTTDRYNLLKFSDGSELKTIVQHHIFNKQAREFTAPMTDKMPIGTISFNDQGEEITLISKEVIHESVDFYNIWTRYHLNAFANGILTGNRYCNIYPIENMKYVKDDRLLRPVEEFEGIDNKYISGMRLTEQTFDLPFIQTMVDRITSLDSMAVITV
jgi:hypothetical protein